MYAKLAGDRRKYPELHEYHVLTMEECQRLASGTHSQALGLDGTICNVKVTSVKTWVRRPDIEVHCQYGLYTYWVETFTPDRPNEMLVKLTGNRLMRWPKDKMPARQKSEIFANCGTFDFALPQPTLDAMVKQSGLGYHLVLSTTVWSYTEESRIFGAPLSCCTEVQAAWDYFMKHPAEVVNAQA